MNREGIEGEGKEKDGEIERKVTKRDIRIRGRE
jgi:hypothetical protein